MAGSRLARRAAAGDHVRMILRPGFLLLGLLLAGCTSMQRYGEARTMPAGALAFSAAWDLVEGYEPQLEETFDPSFPGGTPRVGLRYGLAGGTEVGLEAGALHGTVDLKQELLRSRIFDLALAPALTAGWQGLDAMEPVVLGQLPLLVGLHATDWLTFVPQVGAGYGWRRVESEFFLPARPTRWVGSALLSGGLGVLFRLGDHVALQPLATVHVEVASGYRYTTGGIGFFYGGLPERGAL